MYDDEPPPIDPDDILPATARFDLSVSGRRSGSFLVIFSEATDGWHFAVPREPEPVRIGNDGSVRAPKRGLKFSVSGLHTFYAFVVWSQLPPGIISRAGRPAPLAPADLDAFAVELQTRRAKFHMGRRTLFVET